MTRVSVAAYFLSVARQASARADAADKAGISRDVAEVARIQGQHERQLAAMAGLLSAYIAGGLPVPGEDRPSIMARIRLAWAVLWG